MKNSTGTLLELALTEQEARNAAALTAIRARRTDIAELQQLSEALAARGFIVHPTITTKPCGTNAVCELHMYMTCTRDQLSHALEWLNSADITVTRFPMLDIADACVYQLTLRGQSVQLNVISADARKAPPRLPRNTVATAS